MILEELHHLAEEERERHNSFRLRLGVCVGAGCISIQSDQTLAELQNGLKDKGLADEVEVVGVGCLGLCGQGPLVRREPDGAVFRSVSPTEASNLLDYLNQDDKNPLLCASDMPFFQKQKKAALEQMGRVNPERIESYIALGGYETLLNIITELSPAQVIETVTKSGLRGRGGAGYPTGLKWSTVAKASGGRKYVICNGDEGDPGAFMDRSIMEGDPHRALEGMAIAAYAVGAQRGYIYVRAEYPLAVKRLKTAINRAERFSLLGQNIGGANFNFQIEIRMGAGAFVCGEETALIASIEGNRGTPRPRPPYPAGSGLWGSPTLINNVETYANIPTLLHKGADWFASIGVEKSKGTKVFCLTGAIMNTGLVEVPMGITLREMIFDIGGGIPNGGKFKAVQTGGPSGGCISADHLDMPIDYETLKKVGSIMGSGGMIVMDETSCMVDVARFFMEFCMTESCGKCIPCRVGTAQMHLLLKKITQGEATLDDLNLLERLCDMVSATSLCGLGQAAPNPVRSTLRFFREEYISHIVEKRCPAGVCELERKIAVTA